MSNSSHGDRAIVYCIVPTDLARRVAPALRRHFGRHSDVEVVVEQRVGDRRAGSERRSGTEQTASKEDRRTVRGARGRRIAERRELVTTVTPPPLPRAAQRHAHRLVFIERMEQPTVRAEDIDSQRLVLSFQAGDQNAFAELYMRYFDRIYSYLRVVLRDEHDAEEAAQQVFLNVFTALPRYRPRREPFRAWLFTIARNQAISVLRKQGRLQPADPATIERHRDREEMGTLEVSALQWVTDRELLMLVERLPVSQRQALMLRYMLDLSYAEVAQVLGRRPDDVRMLTSRAQRFLRDRLVALGRGTERGRPQRMLRRPAHAYIARRRRFALLR